MKNTQSGVTSNNVVYKYRDDNEEHYNDQTRIFFTQTFHDDIKHDV